jgi:hypothetical protein
VEVERKSETRGTHLDIAPASLCLSVSLFTHVDMLPGLSVCTDCAAGSWRNATGGTAANDCTNCTLGQHRGVAGQTSNTCEDCPAGKFGASTGMSVCTDTDGPATILCPKSNKSYLYNIMLASVICRSRRVHQLSCGDVEKCHRWECGC